MRVERREAERELYRQRTAAPTWTVGLVAGLPSFLGMAVTLGLLLGGIAAETAMLPALGCTAVAALATSLMVTFAAAQVTVSERAVRIRIGPIGPVIPIEDVARANLGPSGSGRRGIGVVRGLNGTVVYNLLGDPGCAVWLERVGLPPVAIVCRAPELVVAAVEEARLRWSMPRRDMPHRDMPHRDMPRASGSGHRAYTPTRLATPLPSEWSLPPAELADAPTAEHDANALEQAALRSFLSTPPPPPSMA